MVQALEPMEAYRGTSLTDLTRTINELESQFGITNNELADTKAQMSTGQASDSIAKRNVVSLESCILELAEIEKILKVLCCHY